MNEVEKDNFTVVELSPVERKDVWYLWEIEDRVAQRMTPVFCAPSITAIERQFQEICDKQKAKPGDLAKRIIAVYNQGKFLVMEE